MKVATLGVGNDIPEGAGHACLDEVAIADANGPAT